MPTKITKLSRYSLGYNFRPLYKGPILATTFPKIDGL